MPNLPAQVTRASCLHRPHSSSRWGGQGSLQLRHIVLAHLLLENVLKPLLHRHGTILGLPQNSFAQELPKATDHRPLEDSDFHVFREGASSSQAGPSGPPLPQSNSREGCGLALFPQLVVLVSRHKRHDLGIQPGEAGIVIPCPWRVLALLHERAPPVIRQLCHQQMHQVFWCQLISHISQVGSPSHQEILPVEEISIPLEELTPHGLDVILHLLILSGPSHSTASKRNGRPSR
jgi:hypothetical protein